MRYALIVALLVLLVLGGTGTARAQSCADLGALILAGLPHDYDCLWNAPATRGTYRSGPPWGYYQDYLTTATLAGLERRMPYRYWYYYCYLGYWC